MLPGSVCTDSDVVAELLAHSFPETEDLARALQAVMPIVEGAFSMVLMNSQRLFGLRDPHGFRPLCLGRLGPAEAPEGWVLASETPALSIIGASFVREVEPGELVVIDADGPHSLEIPWLRPVEPRLCIFEFAYIARPDSRLYGREVHETRCRMGELLALQAPAEADMVMGVPESGVPAAEGFARASGIPYGQGLVKNRYIGRSFIAPGQKERADAVRRKLNPLADAIVGKRLVVVDDSIVRGTTQRSVIKMLREAGAAEVHLRISSPPWRWPCFYGIDTPVGRRALGHRPHGRRDGRRPRRGFAGLHQHREPARAIGADGGFCDACFTGELPHDGARLLDAGHLPGAGGGRGPPGRAPRGLSVTQGGGATYAAAGVDIAAGDAAVERLRTMVAGIGGFGGQFPLDMARFTRPVLVASTDGVGTKLAVARATGRYETVGIDLVAMCVDDLVCVGAEPLFMLDYLATGKVDPDHVATIVAGVHEGCRQAGCALIGGETAEHAGVMAPDEVDLAGFAVGAVEDGTQLGPERVRAGDAIVGLASPGPALQRLHPGPPRAARAGRPASRRPGLGRCRGQRGRRAAAAVGDLHPGRAGRARPRWATTCTPAPTSPAAASSATCPGPCPPGFGCRPGTSDLDRAAHLRGDPAPGSGGRGRDGSGLQPGHRHDARRRGGARSRRPWPCSRRPGSPAADRSRGGRAGCPLHVSRDAFPELRAHLLEHSVKTGDFTLKSGKKSSWFIDSKQTVCRPEAMVLVADAVLSLVPDEATAIGGLTMGADPVAFVTAGVAATRGRSLKAFSVRKEVKDHGGGGRIAGALDPGDKVVVTEDTVTRGTSLLEAAHAVQDVGAEVVLLVAVVDRGGTVEAMAAAEGIPFRAVLTAPDLGFPFEGA